MVGVFFCLDSLKVRVLYYLVCFLMFSEQPAFFKLSSLSNQKIGFYT
jgi:hypothetical protein